MGCGNSTVIMKQIQENDRKIKKMEEQKKVMEDNLDRINTKLQSIKEFNSKIGDLQKYQQQLETQLQEIQRVAQSIEQLHPENIQEMGNEKQNEVQIETIYKQKEKIQLNSPTMPGIAAAGKGVDVSDSLSFEKDLQKIAKNHNQNKISQMPSLGGSNQLDQINQLDVVPQDSARSQQNHESQWGKLLNIDDDIISLRAVGQGQDHDANLDQVDLQFDDNEDQADGSPKSNVLNEDIQINRNSQTQIQDIMQDEEIKKVFNEVNKQILKQ